MSEGPRVPTPSPDPEALFADALDELLSAWASGRAWTAAEVLAAHPDLTSRVAELFDLAREIAVVRPPMQPRVPGYEILEEAGRGGMGVVYRARQTGLARHVALKVMAGNAEDGRLRDRFLAEARALGRVRHPHVVTIFEVIELPDLCAYAMEWIEGRSLAELVEHRLGSDVGSDDPIEFRGPDGDPLCVEPTTWVCRLGIAIARALTAIHREGLLHRDVKPGNVLVRADGTPLLSDFGLVHDESLDLTRSGQFLGTAAFAPPEQLRGESAALASTVDVYGLGATLHCALLGQPPYPGRTPAEVLVAVEARRRRRLTMAGLPEDLETIVGKCLEADPRDRYQDAATVADELERLLALRPIRARPLGWPARLWRSARRNRRLLVTSAMAGLLVLAACAVLGFWLYQRWTLPERLARALLAARVELLDPTHTERAILADRGPETPGAAQAGSRPVPLLAAVDSVRAAYARVVALDPDVLANQVEAELVEVALPFLRAQEMSTAVALGFLRAQELPPTPALARVAPQTLTAARTWLRAPDATPELPDDPADRRALGLLAFLTGRAGMCHLAWDGMALAGDPFIDAASAQLLVTRGEFERAFPRFARAADAWPQVGFLAVGMARCALAANDPVVAERHLARAEALGYLDPFNTLRAVRGEILARRGRWDEACAEFEWMLDHHRAIEVRVAYSRLLAQRGELRRACDLQLQVAEMEPESEQIRHLPGAVLLWSRFWKGLDARGRSQAILWDWQLGVFGLGYRMQSILAKAPPRVRAAVHAAVGPEGRWSMASAAWIADTTRWVTWLPTDWRRAHALMVVLATTDRMLAFGWHRPWVLAATQTLHRALFGASEIACQVIAGLGAPRVTWEPTATGLPPRAVVGVDHDTTGGRTIAFGGWSAPGAPGSADSWLWADGRWTQLAPAGDPGGRFNGAFAFDGSGWMTFGGVAVDRELVPPATWRLNRQPGGWAWTNPARDAVAPPNRSSHMMAFDRHRGVVVLFGGQGKTGVAYNDTWEWSGAQGRWSLRVAHDRGSVTQPPPVAGGCMVYDQERRVTLLLGGLVRRPEQPSGPRGMWAWNGGAWTRLPESLVLPPDRTLAGFVYCPARRTCLLHGGGSVVGRTFADTWEWDGGRWRLLDSGSRGRSAMRGRARPGMLVLADGAILVFGGAGNGGREAFGDAWIGRIVGR